MSDKDPELDDPAAPEAEPDAEPGADAGPNIDLNVNGGNPLDPEPVDEPVEED
jgi:hypothetical protein